MISIIICSKNTDISSTLWENIQKTIGVEHEFIVIDNSENKYSIFSAYNKGVEVSKFPYLVFVHEDILFQTQNWGKNVINHLNDRKIGLIGVAGNIMATRVPASWWMTKGYKNLIQHYKSKGEKQSDVYQNDFSPKEAVVLDGVFLASRKELFEKIKFDENLTGFHGYDHDICIQSKVAGFNNLVVFNILLEHFSEGKLSFQYYENLTKVYKKWVNKLPIYTSDVSSETKLNLQDIEEKLLQKLIRRLARIGFKTDEIVDVANYFAKTIGIKQQLHFLRLKIAFEKVFNASKV